LFHNIDDIIIDNVCADAYLIDIKKT